MKKEIIVDDLLEIKKLTNLRKIVEAIEYFVIEKLLNLNPIIYYYYYFNLSKNLKFGNPK